MTSSAVGLGLNAGAAPTHRRLRTELRAYRRSLARAGRDRAIFRRLPELRDLIEFRVLADALPTPIDPPAIADVPLWVKRDDRTSSLYGGNKVRKLEYVLARAARRDAVVVTGGGTASHHVMATVLYCHMLDIDCEVVLFDQPPNPTVEAVRTTLDLTNTRVRYIAETYQYPIALAAALADVARRGRLPQFVYPGASTPVGNLGYVDCGLEIAAAVHAGDCPEPDALFCALGSGGMTVGVALGLGLGGLQTRVHAVRSADAVANNEFVLSALEAGTRAILAFAGVRMASALDRVVIEDAYFGAGYGFATDEGRAAADTAALLGLPIDQTYTAKALAAALDYVRQHPGATTMFLDSVAGPSPVLG